MRTLKNTPMLSRCRILAGLVLLNTLSAFTNGDSAPATKPSTAPGYPQGWWGTNRAYGAHTIHGL